MSEAVRNYIKSLNWGHRVQLRDKWVDIWYFWQFYVFVVVLQCFVAVGWMTRKISFAYKNFSVTLKLTVTRHFSIIDWHTCIWGSVCAHLCDEIFLELSLYTLSYSLYNIVDLSKNLTGVTYARVSYFPSALSHGSSFALENWMYCCYQIVLIVNIAAVV